MLSRQSVNVAPARVSHLGKYGATLKRRWPSETIRLPVIDQQPSNHAVVKTTEVNS